MPDSLDGLTPEAYRARYDDLMCAAQANAALFAPSSAETAPVRAIAPDAVVARETIPAGWYWTQTLQRGRTLRIENTSGTPGVAAFFWNARETSERYCMGDTVKIQWTVRPRAGRLLLSDMGRVLVSIVGDTDGIHEPLLGGTLRDPSDDVAARNARENFLLAAGKMGLGKRDIAPCITFFAGVETDASGNFRWSATQPSRGSFVDLRAEMDILIAISNTPHPLAPSRVAAGSIDATVWAAPDFATNDRCRTSTVEARRAFQNTDDLVRA